MGTCRKRTERHFEERTRKELVRVNNSVCYLTFTSNPIQKKLRYEDRFGKHLFHDWGINRQSI